MPGAERNKNYLIRKSKNELLPILEKEKNISYLNYTGEIWYSFQNNQLLLKAISILNDKSFYNKQLKN